MTIVHCRELVQGNSLDGYRASCHECHGSNFIKSVHKHLPDGVVANKFRERGWEINSNGKDHCPNCIVTKRGPRKTRNGFNADEKNRLHPVRDIIPINIDNLRKLLIASGLPVSSVIELESRDRKFRITFNSTAELQIGQIVHAEGEAVSALGAALKSSYLKNELIQTAEKDGVISLKLVLHWYLALEINEKMVAAE